MAYTKHVDLLERTAFQVREQRLRLGGSTQHRFRHAVVQQRGDGLDFVVGQLLRRAESGAEDAALQHDLERHAALDAIMQRKPRDPITLRARTMVLRDSVRPDLKPVK